jgi:acyl transferase domain-containing protein/phosphopantetheinyl transferase
MHPRRDGVAIIGMSCVFPGAPNVDAYWRNILNKVDAVTDPPDEAWDVETYYDPEFRDTDKTYVKRGGYLGALNSFDPLAYGVPPVSVGGEPDQWLALKLAYDALEDAGCSELPAEVRARTGIVLGKGTYLNGGNAIAVQRGLVVSQTLDVLRQLRPEYTDADIELLREEMKHALPPIGPETVPGLIPNIIVGRIANRLDLMGPSYTVDAACASSLVAIQQAMRDLVDGVCDLALAGGSQVWMPVPTLNVFCQLGALSRSERIRPFDKDADGTLLGEGIGMVVLKRTADALRDGDRIYAVVKGVGVASDGRGVSVMAPRVEGEELALRTAYEDAGLSPSTVGLVEAHGTATAVGDVVEVQALTRVFGEREGDLPSCAIGTVKSMISHTIPASGVAGVIKLALALYHRVLPPTLNCDEPNPKLELEKTPFYVNTETRPWIHGSREPRRAGVNAFGFGGINAHAILEELPASSEVPLDHLPPWDSEVCVLQGESQAALLDEARRLRRRLAAPSTAFSLTDLAYTLNCGAGRAENALLLAIVADSLDDLTAKLDRAIQKLEQPECRRIKDISGIYYEAEPLGREGKVVFVFPGEGAQYAGMLADLCLHFPEVREAFDRSDRLYRDHPRGYVTSDWVYPRPAFSDEERGAAEGRLMQMDIAVEAVLTANQAMHGLLERIGLRPDACVGHSTGEYSAAYAAGVLVIDTEEQFFEFCRGLHRCYSEAESQDHLPRAVLLTVAAERERVEEIAREAGGDLFVAMDNCPHQAVLVGESAAVERAREIAARESLIYGELPYDRAVHTPLFDRYADDLREVFDGVTVGPSSTALWSCTTAAPYPDEEAAVRELFVDHWTHPVEFRGTIEALYDQGARVFVEAGPRGNLTGFLDDILRGRSYCAVPADLPRRSGIAQLNHLVAMLSAHGVDMDAAYLYERRKARPVSWDDAVEAPRARAGTTVALAMRWPILRLPERLREIGAAAPVANGNGHGPPTLVPEPPPAAPAADPPASQPVAKAVAPVYAADGLEDERDVVMDAHVATMAQFLTTHEQVMQAFLAEAALDAAALETPPEPAVAATAGPLLGTVTAWTPGASLVARRVVDPDDDVYLRDHALGRAVSTTDPTLSALMVMPLTMSFEILAEAGAFLVPGCHVTGLRDVRAYRWLAWEDEPRTLEVTAERLPSSGAEDLVHVKLFDLGESGDDGDAGQAPAVEAVVVLADAYPAPPPGGVTRVAGGVPSQWRSESLYADGMFHGPSWQGVRSIEETSPDGCSARLEVLPFTGLLRGDPDPAFVLDPVVLDAAGQVIGFWTAERLQSGRVIFPFRLEALDVFGSQRPQGEVLGCTAAIELIGDQLVRSDIDVGTGDGVPWMRLTGWEDKRFDVPPEFAPLARLSDPAPLSAEWRAPLAGLPGDAAVECRRSSAILPDRAFWKRVWACRVLSRAERAAFRQLRLPEPRALEWLAARTAAKEAVQRLVETRYGLDLLPADIEILPDALGRPVVGGSWTADVAPAPVVSLAHTQGLAVAIAALGGRVGIDVEVVRAREQGFADVAFAPGEIELLAAFPPEVRDEWTLRFWCAKEAVGKALGTGLTRGPQGLSVTAVETAAGTIQVRLGAEMARDHQDLAESPIVVHTLREGDLVVATTLCEQEGSEDGAG